MPSDPFPNRTDNNSKPTSPATAEYNCVAWAAHDQRNYIWPDARQQFAWPPNLPRIDSVPSIRFFFESIGFSVCLDGRLEAGFEKVAIYADGNGPQHVARQLRSGIWTSKLGPAADIEHTTVNVLESGPYGNVVLYMKRRSNGPPTLPPLHPPPAKLITPGGDPLVP